jgi:kynurenine formamidase
MTLLDLSHPITAAMPVWPGDPEVVLTRAATTHAHGYNLLSVHLGSQSGTHVDAPYHVDDSLPTLDQLPLERFTGPAVVADLRGQAGAIRAEDLDDLDLRPGAVLLLCTGWSRHWGTLRYAEHPWLDTTAARLLLGHGIRTIGIDAPSIDAPGSADLPTHRVLARAGVVIAENLTNLDQVPAGATVWLLPLPLQGADGAPVRAVASF